MVAESGASVPADLVILAIGVRPETELAKATGLQLGSRGGISCFLVDMDTPGVNLTTQYETLTGERPWEIVLDGVRIHERQRIGEEGRGFALGHKWLASGRLK